MIACIGSVLESNKQLFHNRRGKFVLLNHWEGREVKTVWKVNLTQVKPDEKKKITQHLRYLENNNLI